MMGRNGTARITCCLCVPIYPAAIIISVLGVLSGSAFGIVYAKNIANSAGTFFAPADNKLYNAIPFVGMGCWSLLALVSLFGCIACWTRRARLVSVYFYLLLLQYILDLAFLIAGIVIAFKTAEDQRSECIADTARAGFSNGEILCRSALGITALIFISVLGVYKLLSLYTTYVIFKYKRYTAVEESMKNQAKEVEAQRNSAWNNSYDPSQPPQNWSKFED